MPSSAQNQSSSAFRPAPWLIVAMLCAISMTSYIERVNISAVGPSLESEFQITNFELGSLFSAFLLGYTLCQFPSGLLADRFGPRRVLGWAMLCCGVLTVLTAVADRVALYSGWGLLATLLPIRFLYGVATAPTYPAAGRSILCWVAGPRRAVANAIVIAGLSMGTAITPPIIAFLLLHTSWQTSLLFTALPAFLMAALWSVLSRDDGPETMSHFSPKKPDLLGQNNSTPGEVDILPRRQQPRTAFLRDKDLWFLTASYALQGYVSYIFVYWFFLYLVQERQFSLLKGSWLATTPWLLTLFTMPVGGILSDRLIRRVGYPWGRRAVPLLALALAGFFLFLGSRTDQPYLAVALFALCQGLVMATEGVFWASVIEISPDHAGSGGGILNMGGNLGGLLSPMITPLVAQKFGWVAALDIGAVIAVVAGSLWFWVSPGRNAPRPLVVTHPAGPVASPKSPAISTYPLP